MSEPQAMAQRDPRPRRDGDAPARASDQNGRGRNMLSWSVLGLLVKDGRLRKSGHHYFLV